MAFGSYCMKLQGSLVESNSRKQQGLALLEEITRERKPSESSEWPAQVKLLVWRAKHLAAVVHPWSIFTELSHGFSEAQLIARERSACMERIGGVVSCQSALSLSKLLCTVAAFATLQVDRRWRARCQKRLSSSDVANLQYAAELFDCQQAICRLELQLLAERKAKENDVMNLREYDHYWGLLV
ncbi:hypothetical protein WJX75_003529 [Coccomyxa subellipsoidea]|uniref:Uncharacterized protein n=1 Tax=Coccomyxa subellipsoidea TaxID=248742 RepID=A0ABR2YF52_9CHLO